MFTDYLVCVKSTRIILLLFSHFWVSNQGFAHASQFSFSIEAFDLLGYLCSYFIKDFVWKFIFWITFNFGITILLLIASSDAQNIKFNKLMFIILNFFTVYEHIICISVGTQLPWNACGCHRMIWGELVLSL